MTMQQPTIDQHPDHLALAVRELEPESALALRSAFETMFAQADEWTARAKSIRVTSADDKRGMKLARESRLALREIRVNAEHARKRLKEDSTRRGKAIDGIANVLKALIEPLEEHLLEQETFAARAEAARRDALRDARAETLRALGTDPTAYADLGATSEETWAETLATAKAAHEARLEAERQAVAVRVEVERLAAERRQAERAAAAKAEAERVERERLVREENDRLRREGAEREAAAQAERAQVEQERQAEQAKAKAAFEAAADEARNARAEADRLAAAKAAGEQAAREREEQAAAAREAAALAPDRDKLRALAFAVRAIDLPTLSTAKGQRAMATVADQFTKMAAWLDKTAGAL